MLSRFFVFLFSFSSLSLYSLEKKSEDFNPNVSYDLVKKGALLLDVRSKKEYDQKHVKGSIHIPFTQIEAKKDFIIKLMEKRSEKAIVVYCRSGRRSGIAKKTLEKLGYKKVVNHGPMNTWKDL